MAAMDQPETDSTMPDPITEQYAERIKEFFPDVDLRSCELNTAGLVNDVVLAEGTRVFRFPKNDSWARKWLEHEIRVLNLLAVELDVRVPEFDVVQDDFVSYRMIPGEPLCREDLLKLESHHQERLAEQVALFLRQLHGVSQETLSANGISKSRVNRSRETWLKLLADVRQELFPKMMQHSKDWVDRHFEPVEADPTFFDYSPCLVSGDIPPYHILWNRSEMRLEGVIDFGTAGVGDPACDFACIIYNYGESFLRMMEKYNAEIGDSIDRARFWSGTLELQWALIGIRKNNPMWHTVHIGAAKDFNANFA